MKTKVLLPDRQVIGRPLPLMAGFQDAAALYEREKDPFYLAAFKIQCWLGGLVLRATAEYAEKKHPRDRSFQTGESWRAFLGEFSRMTERGYCPLLSFLFRFAGSDHSPANTLRNALLPLLIEREYSGDYLSARTLRDFEQGWVAAQARRGSAKAHAIHKDHSKVNDLAQKTILRWCDWLDAAVHLRTHCHWHASPASFDPDPENRLLAGLGEAERHIAHLDQRAQLSWVWEFAHAAARYKHSPKWAVVGKGMSDDSGRRWEYPDVDTCVIALWPLVKAYNWTYRDLLTIIKPGLKRPNSYPCDREQDFATYCVNVLGLRKTGKGASGGNGRPAGHDIARKYCPGLGRPTPAKPNPASSQSGSQLSR